MDPNAPLASALLLETHHPIMSMLVQHGGWLEIEREDSQFLKISSQQFYLSDTVFKVSCYVI